MKAYLIQIVTMSLLCGLVEMLIPAGEREGLRRSVRLLTALCLMCLMISPLRETREFFRSLNLGTWARGVEGEAQEEYERMMEQKLSAATREQLCEELYVMLDEQFDISRADCTLTVDFEEGDEALKVRQVWIALHGKAVLRDPRTIETAVSGILNCPCTVSVG